MARLAQSVFLPTALQHRMRDNSNHRLLRTCVTCHLDTVVHLSVIGFKKPAQVAEAPELELGVVHIIQTYSAIVVQCGCHAGVRITRGLDLLRKPSDGCLPP
eukprot:scaffold610788_cov35-Prasinocladus_malaysianus.AAC.1